VADRAADRDRLPHLAQNPTKSSRWIGIILSSGAGRWSGVPEDISRTRRSVRDQRTWLGAAQGRCPQREFHRLAGVTGVSAFARTPGPLLIGHFMNLETAPTSLP